MKKTPFNSNYRQNLEGWRGFLTFKRKRFLRKLKIPTILILIILLGIIVFPKKKEPILQEQKEEIQKSILAIFVDDKRATEIPSKTSGYYLDLSKSNCNNHVNLTWDYYNWKAKLNFTNYQTDNNQRTKCMLHFKKCNISPNTTYTYDFTGHEQEFVPQCSGLYQIELWGAGGGIAPTATNTSQSLGGYAKGTIELTENQKLYVYVGEKPSYTSSDCYEDNPNNAFNASIYGSCTGGGGATDIRLTNGNWYNFDSLKSRIMVASGAGGIHYSGGQNGDAGGLIGYDGEGTAVPGTGYNPHVGIGGSQTNLYFGNDLSHSTTSGGGGYYTGSGGYAANAGGGSSFISGHDGCDAITENSTEENIVHTKTSFHYSGLSFTNTQIIDGRGYNWTTKKEDYVEMPSFDGTSKMKGNNSHGHAKITFLGTSQT